MTRCLVLQSLPGKTCLLILPIVMHGGQLLSRERGANKHKLMQSPCVFFLNTHTRQTSTEWHLGWLNESVVIGLEQPCVLLSLSSWSHLSLHSIHWLWVYCIQHSITPMLQPLQYIPRSSMKTVWTLVSQRDWKRLNVNGCRSG